MTATRPTPHLDRLKAELARAEEERDDLLAHNTELVDAAHQRDNARGELKLAREEIARLQALLNHADVLLTYPAWKCLGGSPNCGRRYFDDDPGHGCGPLTPVTVTISRRSA